MTISNPVLHEGMRNAFEQLARDILTPTTKETPMSNPFAEKEFLGINADSSASFVDEDWYPQSYVDELNRRFNNAKYILTDVQAFIDDIVDEIDADHDVWDNLQRAFDDGSLTDPRKKTETFTFKVTMTREVSVEVEFGGDIDEKSVMETLLESLEETSDLDDLDMFGLVTDRFDIVDVNADSAETEVEAL